MGGPPRDGKIIKRTWQVALTLSLFVSSSGRVPWDLGDTDTGTQLHAATADCSTRTQVEEKGMG